MSEAAIDLLLRRRSVVAKMLTGPGPDADELKQILTAGTRVPDHKMLSPWRVMVFQDESRVTFGKLAAAVGCLENTDLDFSADVIAADLGRFERAPVVLAVISTIKDTKPVPEWEQTLSAGAVCQNMLLAAASLGYSAQWVTEWLAFSEMLRPVLGLGSTERVAGFIYVGTAREAPKERGRPVLDDVVSDWQVPAPV